MLKRVALLVVLAVGLLFAFGCTANTGYSPTQNLRRAMITGEQLKLIGQDVDFIFDVDDYPVQGRWNY